MKWFLLILVAVVVFFVVYSILTKNKYPLVMYFGSPGCGKSTLLAREIAKTRWKRYSNFPIKDLDVTMFPSDKTFYKDFTVPDNSLIVIDEAGIDYNNRKSMNKATQMSQLEIEQFKLHRHNKHRIIISSQSWEDVSVVLRRLVDKLVYCKAIGPFTFCRTVNKRVTVDDQTQQIIDGYRFVPFSLKIIYRPRWYKYFDSFAKGTPLPLLEDLQNGEKN